MEIFDWLRSLEPSHELASLCDVYTYTTIVSQCGSIQQLRRALELVAEMRSRGVGLNCHAFSALMNGANGYLRGRWVLYLGCVWKYMACVCFCQSYVYLKESAWLLLNLSIYIYCSL